MQMMGPEEKNLHKLYGGIRCLRFSGKLESEVIVHHVAQNGASALIDLRWVERLFGEVFIMILSHFKRRPYHLQANKLHV